MAATSHFVVKNFPGQVRFKVVGTPGQTPLRLVKLSNGPKVHQR